MPMPLPINKPIVKLTEKSIEQPNINANIPIPESSRMHDKITPTPDIVIPQTRSGNDSSSRKVKRKTIQDSRISQIYCCSLEIACMLYFTIVLISFLLFFHHNITSNNWGY